MGRSVETLLVILLLTNLLFLGTSRLVDLVKLLAGQGLILGLIALAVEQDFGVGVLVLAFGTAMVKAVLFPWLLLRTIRSLNIRREVEPVVAYGYSIIAGVLLFGFSSWLSGKLPSVSSQSSLIVPVAFFTTFTGFFLIMTRLKAITEVIGYLVLENGIYLFGLAFVEQTKVLVELGILLDITVGTFLMNIILTHIKNEFRSLNVDNLATLRDWNL